MIFKGCPKGKARSVDRVGKPGVSETQLEGCFADGRWKDLFHHQSHLQCSFTSFESKPVGWWRSIMFTLPSNSNIKAHPYWVQNLPISREFYMEA